MEIAMDIAMANMQGEIWISVVVPYFD